MEMTERVELHKRTHIRAHKHRVTVWLVVRSSTLQNLPQVSDLCAQKARGQSLTRAGEAAVHVGSVPRLHGAVHRRQRAEGSLAGERRDCDHRLLPPILVLVPRAWALSNHTGLWTGH